MAKTSNRQKEKLIPMDAIDAQILMELMVDAQTPFLQIAKKIGVSHRTVGKRFEKMKKDGIIGSCTVLIDGRKLGDEGTIFLMLSCVREANKQAVMEDLEKIPDLYLIVELMGDYDFLAWARFRNMQQLSQLVGDIRNLGNIDRLETLLLTQTYFTFSLAPEVAIKCDGMDFPKRP
jgi:Lrp/AsnC family transcriptional regulator, regulator for asnA, asnC and gidA